MKIKSLIFLFCLGCFTSSAAIDEQRLVDAIGHAENSKNHPYGVLVTFKHTSPRQACFNTVDHALKRWLQTNQKEDFIVFLSKTYCPIGATNDPKNLNSNWVKNVTFFYEKKTK